MVENSSNDEKISVVMCTYNGSAFLPVQLESLLRQTRLPDELIICDDASPDGETRRILEDFVQRSPFTVHLHINAENMGCIANFGKAIGLATGDFIFLCDQDDRWKPHKIERTMETFQKNPAAGLVFSDAEVVDSQLHPLRASLWECMDFTPQKQRTIGTDQAFDTLLAGCVVTGAAMAFRAIYKELVLPIPVGTTMLHDGWIAVLIAAVAPIAICREELIEYRQHAGQQIGALVPVEPGGSPFRESALRKSILTIPPKSGEHDKLRLIHERLMAQRNRFPESAAFRKLDATLQEVAMQKRHIEEERAHLRARSGLPKAHWRRPPIIARELLARRYHLYSKGLLSALKDLLTQPPQFG